MIRDCRLFRCLRAVFQTNAVDSTNAAGPSGGYEPPAALEAIPAIYISASAGGPLRQTEILSDVVQRRRSFRSLKGEKPELEEIRHPYAIVVTQDCDLEQDFTARKSTTPQEDLVDKLIPNVLLTEAVTASQLTASLARGRDIRKRVLENKDERYHVLQKVEANDDALGEGLPALGVDFKRHFTIPTDELYVQLDSNAKRRSHLNSPYLEHFAKRFAVFVSRVALPKEHQIE